MTDRLYIANLVNYKEAGVYSLASKFVQVITLFAGSILQAYGPYFYKVASNFTYAEAAQKLKPINECITLLVCFIAVLICLLSKQVVYFCFSNEYKTCLPYVFLLSLSSVFMQQTGYLNLMIYQNKKTIGICLITVSCAIISLVLNYLLITSYGALAAGFSNLLTGGIMFGLTFLLARKNYYIPIKISIIFVSMLAFVMLFFSDSFVENIFFNLLVKIVIFVSLAFGVFRLILSKEAYSVLLILKCKFMCKKR